MVKTEKKILLLSFTLTALVNLPPTSLIEAGTYFFINTTKSYYDTFTNAFSVVVSPNYIDNTIYTEIELILTNSFVNAVFEGSSDLNFIGNVSSNILMETKE